MFVRALIRLRDRIHAWLFRGAVWYIRELFKLNHDVAADIIKMAEFALSEVIWELRRSRDDCLCNARPYLVGNSSIVTITHQPWCPQSYESVVAKIRKKENAA